MCAGQPCIRAGPLGPTASAGQRPARRLPELQEMRREEAPLSPPWHLVAQGLGFSHSGLRRHLERAVLCPQPAQLCGANRRPGFLSICRFFCLGPRWPLLNRLRHSHRPAKKHHAVLWGARDPTADRDTGSASGGGVGGRQAADGALGRLRPGVNMPIVLLPLPYLEIGY